MLNFNSLFQRDNLLYCIIDPVLDSILQVTDCHFLYYTNIFTILITVIYKFFKIILVFHSISISFEQIYK